MELVERSEPGAVRDQGGAISRITARRPHARILIVDDEQSNVRLLARQLGRSGYASVRTLTDAPGALQEYRDFEPDLVLLDLRMPQLDGFTLLRLLKQVRRPDGWVPVLVISGDTSLESRQRARVLGASDFVLKPYDMEDLLLRIDTLLELRQQAQTRARELDRLRTELAATAEGRAETELHALAGLSAACAFRDSASEGHTTRVGELAAEIAQELKLPAEMVDMLRQCAPLHDVGKIAIPDDILLKTGPLTDAEMAIAERHTTIGAMILSSSRSPLLQLAAEIALTHHEKWDGSGYPRRLAGDAIPLAGRIVAVADVFDALTHERPYKHAWTVRQTVDEMEQCRGTHFDPVVLDALLSVVPQADGSDSRAVAAVRAA